MDSSTTDETSNIGVMMARQKNISSEFLKINGFPVAPQLSANNLEITLKHANLVGYPVVLKPADQDQGRGISSNIKTEKDLIRIYKETTKVYKNLIIEKHIFGEDYRFSVINGRVTHIFQRIAGGVVGDGKSTIKELVIQLQKSSFYKRKYMEKGKNLIELDTEAIDLLSESNYTFETILKKDEYTPLRRQNNVSTGGKLTRVLNEKVHPDNLKLAVDVAQSFHLDMAGIDIISPDITKSWLETNAIVCEVNAVPELGFSTKLTLAKEILKDVMKDGVRIPIFLIIIDSNNLQDQSLFQELRQSKKYQNYSFGSYVIVDGRIITNRAQNGFRGAQMLLINENVDVAYCFLTPEMILKNGLPADWFEQIQIVTSVNNDFIEKVERHTDHIIFKNIEEL
jgi:cyanophycin synthetase